jgi:hypothetical protein
MLEEDAGLVFYCTETGHSVSAGNAISNQTNSPCMHIGKPVADHRAMMLVPRNVRNGSIVLKKAAVATQRDQ